MLQNNVRIQVPISDWDTVAANPATADQIQSTYRSNIERQLERLSYTFITRTGLIHMLTEVRDGLLQSQPRVVHNTHTDDVVDGTVGVGIEDPDTMRHVTLWKALVLIDRINTRLDREIQDSNRRETEQRAKCDIASGKLAETGQRIASLPEHAPERTALSKKINADQESYGRLLERWSIAQEKATKLVLLYKHFQHTIRTDDQTALVAEVHTIARALDIAIPSDHELVSSVSIAFTLRRAAAAPVHIIDHTLPPYDTRVRNTRRALLATACLGISAGMVTTYAMRQPDQSKNRTAAAARTQVPLQTITDALAYAVEQTDYAFYSAQEALIDRVSNASGSLTSEQYGAIIRELQTKYGIEPQHRVDEYSAVGTIVISGRDFAAHPDTPREQLIAKISQEHWQKTIFDSLALYASADDRIPALMEFIRQNVTIAVRSGDYIATGRYEEGGGSTPFCIMISDRPDDDAGMLKKYPTTIGMHPVRAQQTVALAMAYHITRTKHLLGTTDTFTPAEKVALEDECRSLLKAMLRHTNPDVAEEYTAIVRKILLTIHDEEKQITALAAIATYMQGTDEHPLTGNPYDRAMIAQMVNRAFLPHPTQGNVSINNATQSR